MNNSPTPNKDSMEERFNKQFLIYEGVGITQAIRKHPYHEEILAFIRTEKETSAREAREDITKVARHIWEKEGGSELLGLVNFLEHDFTTPAALRDKTEEV
jgi:hypothetical protein